VASRQLKGFKKVLLEPGESKKITFALTPRDLSIYNVQGGASGKGGWAEVSGEFQLFAGSSSRDIRLTGSYTNAK